MDGDPRPSGDTRDVGADEYRPAVPDGVTDLHATDAITGTGIVTATLQWTAPAAAVTTTLRYSDAPIKTPRARGPARQN